MIGTFVKNSTLYMLANGVNKLIGVAFFAYIARLLSKAEMGEYGLLMVVLTILGLVMTLQIHVGFTRFFFEFPAEQRQRFELGTLNLLFVVNLAIGALFLVLRPWLERLVLPVSTPLLLVLLALPFFQGVAQLYTAKLRLENRAWMFSITSVVGLLVNVGSTLALLRLVDHRPLALFSGVLAQEVFLVVCYGATLGRWRPTINLAVLRPTIVFSAMLVPSAFGLYLTLLTGKYLVGRLLDLPSVGVYEACSRVALIVQVLMQPLLLATGPLVFEQYRNESFRPRYYMLLHIHMVVLMGLVMAFSLLNREAVLFIVGEQYVSYAHWVPVFVMAAVLMHMNGFFVNNVHLSQKTQYLFPIETITGVVSAAATYVLIRWWGFPGAMVAVVLAYGLRYAMYLGLANGLYARLRISVAQSVGHVAACGAILLVHYAVRDWPWPVRAGLLAVELLLLGLLFLRSYGLRWQQVPALLRKA